MENSVGLISSLIVSVIEKKITCTECRNSLYSWENGAHPTAGKLLLQKESKIIPAKDVIDLCIVTNNCIDALVKSKGFQLESHWDSFIIEKALENFEYNERFPSLIEHDLDHKKNICLEVIQQYSKVKKQILMKNQNQNSKSFARGRLQHVGKYSVM